jgi:large subunit ribosomal protein L29
MKTKELREMNSVEISAKIHDVSEELANLKFQHSLHQLENTVKVRKVRRDLARMLTIKKELDLGIAEARVAQAARRAE